MSKLALKPSLYNIVCPSSIGDTFLVYNTLTNAFLTLDKLEYRVASRLFSGKNDYTVSPRVSSLLEKQGFLIPSDLCEETQIEKGFKAARRNKRALALTIAPTMDCNLRCRYCFLEHTEQKMSEEVQAALVAYVRRRLPRKGLFSVTWYGGEPLLEKKIIFSLSQAFRKICEEKQSRYEAHIITNGTLLSENTAKRLKHEHVHSAQVTLDGVPSQHNQRRPFSNNTGSFDVILRHIKHAIPHLDIKLRINIDKSNLKTGHQLLHLLDQEGLLDKIFPYLGRIQPFTDICKHIASDCLDMSQFAELEMSFDLEKGILTKDLRHATLMENRCHYCIADSNQGYVISPEGYLFKCYNEIGDGKEKAVGSVLYKQTNKMRHNLRKWRKQDAFSSPECRACKFLPVCLGGCPWENSQPKGHNIPSCISWRYTGEEHLRFYHALSIIADTEQNKSRRINIDKGCS